MLDTIKTIPKIINDFFEQKKHLIYPATVLVLLIDALVTLPFLREFLITRQVRNFMVFGSALHAGSFSQFASYGIQWLAFVDIFILVPAIVWSMLMPSIVVYVKKMQEEQE